MPPTVETSTRSFVFGLVDRKGQLDTALLYDAAEASGFTSTQIRLGLRRLREAGLVDVEGRGRRGILRLTRAGLAEQAPDLAWVGAAYRADAELDQWDGAWHLASFEIPEANRRARDALRAHIHDLFGGQLSNGLYLSAFAWEPWLTVAAKAHGVPERLTLAQTTSLTHAGFERAADIAQHVWPVGTIHDGYAAFVQHWRPFAASAPEDPHEAIGAAFAAAAQFEHAFRQDPLLPAELVPDDFAAPEARRLFIDLLRTLSTHEVVASANLFGSYLHAVDTAVTQSPGDFWQEVFETTRCR